MSDQPGAGGGAGGATRGGSDRARLILVVEDEEPLRRLVVRMLDRMGFETLAAGDGEEGIRLARSARDKLDLVLTDVIMPRTRGPLMVERLRSEGVHVPVGYMSGYSAEELSQEDRTARFLAKPFTMEELGRFVRSVLDEE